MPSKANGRLAITVGACCLRSIGTCSSTLLALSRSHTEDRTPARLKTKSGSPSRKCTLAATELTTRVYTMPAFVCLTGCAGSGIAGIEGIAGINAVALRACFSACRHPLAPPVGGMRSTNACRAGGRPPTAANMCILFYLFYKPFECNMLSRD